MYIHLQALISEFCAEQRTKRRAKRYENGPFFALDDSLKFVQLFWKEWRGRRDSHSRPLPRQAGAQMRVLRGVNGLRVYCAA